MHLISYFTELWEKKQRYGGATARRHGYAESAANVNKARMDRTHDEQLSKNLEHVAIAATADREHLQQMSNAAGDLLAVIKEQQKQMKEAQEQSREQLKQMKNITEQNGQLAAALAKAKEGTTPRDHGN